MCERRGYFKDPSDSAVHVSVPGTGARGRLRFRPVRRGRCPEAEQPAPGRGRGKGSRCSGGCGYSPVEEPVLLRIPPVLGKRSLGRDQRLLKGPVRHRLPELGHRQPPLEPPRSVPPLRPPARGRKRTGARALLKNHFIGGAGPGRPGSGAPPLGSSTGHGGARRAPPAGQPGRPREQRRGLPCAPAPRAAGSQSAGAGAGAAYTLVARECSSDFCVCPLSVEEPEPAPGRGPGPGRARAPGRAGSSPRQRARKRRSKKA